MPYSLLQEEIEQWTDVFGPSQTPMSTDTPQPGWNRRRYADASGTTRVGAYSIQSAGHSLPSSGMAAQAVGFFGLDGPGIPTTTTTTTTTSQPGAGACRVSSTVNGCSLAFPLPSGQSITSGWNATYSPSSGQVTARNVAYNAAIPANGSIDIGFQASHNGNTANRPPAPSMAWPAPPADRKSPQWTFKVHAHRAATATMPFRRWTPRFSTA